MSDGMIVTPFEHNDSFGYCDLGTLKTVVHIPTRYFNATMLAFHFKTKNNTRKEFFNWKNNNPRIIDAIKANILRTEAHELVNGDIMFIINNGTDISAVTPYVSDEDEDENEEKEPRDTSLSKNDTFNVIKGTYVHSLLAIRLLECLSPSTAVEHTRIVRNVYKKQNYARAVLGNKITADAVLNINTILVDEADDINARLAGIDVNKIKEDRRLVNKTIALANLYKEATEHIRLLMTTTHANIPNKKREKVILIYNNTKGYIKCGQVDYITNEQERLKKEGYTTCYEYNNIANSKGALNQVKSELKISSIVSCTFDVVDIDIVRKMHLRLSAIDNDYAEVRDLIDIYNGNK